MKRVVAQQIHTKSLSMP